VYGKPVIVPATELQVMAAPPPGPVTPRPTLELGQTNLVAGQSVAARIVLTGAAGTAFQTLGQVQFTGEGIVVDQGSIRQRIESKPREFSNAIAFIYEVKITPIQAGKLTVSAQGFTSRNAFSGPIVITNPGAATIFHYTLVPLTAEARATPAISFSCYDPDRAAYVDLTIPAVPVTVAPGQVPSELMALLRTNRSLAKEDEQLMLRGLAAVPG